MSTVTMGIGLLLALVTGVGIGLPVGWVAAAGNGRELARWRATSEAVLPADREAYASTPHKAATPVRVDAARLAQLCAELGEHDGDTGAQPCDCGVPHPFRICARCLLVDDTECGPVWRGSGLRYPGPDDMHGARQPAGGADLPARHERGRPRNR